MADALELGLEGFDRLTGRYHDTIYDRGAQLPQLVRKRRHRNRASSVPAAPPQEVDDPQDDYEPEERPRGGRNNYLAVQEPDDSHGHAVSRRENRDDGRSRRRPEYVDEQPYQTLLPTPREQRTRARSYSTRRDNQRPRRRSRSRTRSRNDEKDHHLGAGLAGAIAGGYLGNEATGGKDKMGALIGAVVGAIGAGLADKMWEKHQRKDDRQDDKWHEKNDR
ncbi:hypothetical protein BT63DRAFT_428000 [Microthyrium microscopicum]|uniref:Glycine zipper 2TM domain-containing protein n=1 Tax=Microthyrium microscopicum TaxID=703497 RepID=A0A6A6U3P9_9PEZI|nr:hypothetical protein BT63DRAFT_428000 [Microthyrium microscopicum]